MSVVAGARRRVRLPVEVADVEPEGQVPVAVLAADVLQRQRGAGVGQRDRGHLLVGRLRSVHGDRDALVVEPDLGDLQRRHHRDHRRAAVGGPLPPGTGARREREVVGPQRRRPARSGRHGQVPEVGLARERPGDAEVHPVAARAGGDVDRRGIGRLEANARDLAAARCPETAAQPVRPCVQSGDHDRRGVHVEGQTGAAVPAGADGRGGAVPGVGNPGLAGAGRLADLVVDGATSGDAVVRSSPPRGARTRFAPAASRGRWWRGTRPRRTARTAGFAHTLACGSTCPVIGTSIRSPVPSTSQAWSSAVRPVMPSARSTAQPLISTRPGSPRGDHTMCSITPSKWLSSGDSRSTRSGWPRRKESSGSSGTTATTRPSSRLGLGGVADVLEVGVGRGHLVPAALRDQLGAHLLAHRHHVERPVGRATEVGLEGGGQQVAIAARRPHRVHDERREVDLERASHPGVVDEVGGLGLEQLVGLLLDGDPVEEVLQPGLLLAGRGEVLADPPVVGDLAEDVELLGADVRREHRHVVLVGDVPRKSPTWSRQNAVRNIRLHAMMSCIASGNSSIVVPSRSDVCTVRAQTVRMYSSCLNRRTLPTQKSEPERRSVATMWAKALRRDGVVGVDEGEELAARLADSEVAGDALAGVGLA